MADPEAHLWHFLGSGSRTLIELLKAYFRHFPALSLPRKYLLLDSQNSFWGFLGSWSEIIDFKFERMFFAFLHLAADLLCAKPAFSKHVDNQLFFWPQGLAALSVSLFCLYASLREWKCGESFLPCSKLWLRNVVSAWGSPSKLIFDIPAASEAQCFDIFPNMFDGDSMLTMFV